VDITIATHIYIYTYPFMTPTAPLSRLIIPFYPDYLLWNPTISSPLKISQYILLYQCYTVIH
jgi:hypothetical protein